MFMINFPGSIVLLPEVTKTFQIRKIQRFDISDTDISDLIIECFSRDKCCQKWHFKQLIFPWYTSCCALFSLREPPKLNKLTNLMIFQILHSSFKFDRIVFWSKWMMSTMLFTTTLNTMTNSWRCTVFLLGASKVDQKTIFSAKWLNFANFRGSWSENCVS